MKEKILQTGSYGKSSSEILEIIQKVCNKLKNRFTFSIYSDDDIYQECYLICYDLLDKWDGRNLEHFLTNAASNNLRTLITSKVCSSNENLQARKVSIDRASSIDGINPNHLPSYELENFSDRFLIEDLDEKIPISHRKNYLKFKEGGKLPHHKKEELLSVIREVYVQDLLPFADTVYNLEADVTIMFSSGILGITEYGYLVKYD